MKNKNPETCTYSLRQPFFPLLTDCFQKIEIRQYGISHFYTFQANGNYFDIAYAVPDGCNDIIFIRRGQANCAFYVGTPLHVNSLNFYRYLQKGDRVFGVRLLQGNMAWLQNCSANDLVNHYLPFLEVGGQEDMVEEICNNFVFSAQIQTFLRYYLPEYERTYQQTPESTSIVFSTLQRIVTSGGEIRVQTLAEQAAYSVRHLNELFRTTYGLSPKEFERIVRFQKSLSMLEQYPRISDAAIESGYYDQSHMLKEYKRFIGVSPKEYIKQRRQHAIDQTLHIQKIHLTKSLFRSQEFCIQVS